MSISALKSDLGIFARFLKFQQWRVQDSEALGSIYSPHPRRLAWLCLLLSWSLSLCLSPSVSVSSSLSLCLSVCLSLSRSPPSHCLSPLCLSVGFHLSLPLYLSLSSICLFSPLPSPLPLPSSFSLLSISLSVYLCPLSVCLSFCISLSLLCHPLPLASVGSRPAPAVDCFSAFPAAICSTEGPPPSVTKLVCPVVLRGAGRETGRLVLGVEALSSRLVVCLVKVHNLSALWALFSLSLQRE